MKRNSQCQIAILSLTIWTFRVFKIKQFGMLVETRSGLPGNRVLDKGRDSSAYTYTSKGLRRCMLSGRASRNIRSDRVMGTRWRKNLRFPDLFDIAHADALGLNHHARGQCFAYLSAPVRSYWVDWHNTQGPRTSQTAFTGAF